MAEVRWRVCKVVNGRLGAMYRSLWWYSAVPYTRWAAAHVTVGLSTQAHKLNASSSLAAMLAAGARGKFLGQQQQQMCATYLDSKVIACRIGGLVVGD
jgi:hypothetical protein